MRKGPGIDCCDTSTLQSMNNEQQRAIEKICGINQATDYHTPHINKIIDITYSQNIYTAFHPYTCHTYILIVTLHFLYIIFFLLLEIYSGVLPSIQPLLGLKYFLKNFPLHQSVK